MYYIFTFAEHMNKKAIYLTLILFLIHVQTIQIYELTKDKLSHLKQFSDYVHHFIFFNHDIAQQITPYLH